MSNPIFPLGISRIHYSNNFKIIIDNCVFQPEVKRAEFMGYLKKTGFIKSIASLILTLYELDTLPEDEKTIEFIAHTMGYGLTVKLEIPAAIAYKATLEQEVCKE